MDLQGIIIDIGQSDISIYRTCIRMAGIIKQFAPVPYIRQRVESIIGTVSAYDSIGEVEAIYKYVQNNLRYTRDPLNWEYIKQPDVMLAEIDQNGFSAADCDEYVVLGLTLCRSIGFPTAIKIASYTSDREFTHVYGMVLVHNQWVVFDAIKAEFNLGDEAGDSSHIDLQITRASIIDVESVPSLAYFL